MSSLFSRSFTELPFNEPIPASLVEPYPWFALHIKSNLEKVSSTILQSKGLSVYCPSFTTKRRWSDRTKEIERPLFPGYVFCRFDPNDRLPILKTHGVLNVVGVAGIPAPIAEDEILSVQKLLRSGLAAGPWPFVRTGQRVIIERGPLAGTEGILVQVKSQFRVVISISLLQRSVAAEIDIEMARPLPTSPKDRLAVAN